MLVAVDIGNSRVKCASFVRGRILARHHAPTEACESTADLVRLLQAATESAADRDALDIAYASVVPRVRPRLIEAAANIGARTLTEVRHDSNLGLELAVESPQAMGPDRIANAIGAVAVLGAPVTIVDFGTAITTTVVTQDRRVIGGSISPGVRTSARALSVFTGRLPEVAVSDRVTLPDPIGNDTVPAIESGILYGTIGAVKELLRRINEQLGVPMPTIATGGMACLLAPHCGISNVDQDLTFRGIREAAVRSGAGIAG